MNALHQADRRSVAVKILYCGLMTLGAALGSAADAKVSAVTPWVLLASSEVGSSVERKVGEAIFTSRALPARLAVLDDDAVGRDGNVLESAPKMLLPKGQQMFGLVAANQAVVFCSTEHKKVGAFNGIFVDNADKHVCLIDTDADGRFDQSYSLRTKTNTGLPIFGAVEPSGNALAQPLPYHFVPSEAYARRFEVRIVLKKIKKGVATMVAQFGSRDTGYIELTQFRKVATGTQPQPFFDESYVVAAAGEKNATFAITRGISPQPFVLDVPPAYVQVFAY